jgi:hypothetical protein
LPDIPKTIFLFAFWILSIVNEEDLPVGPEEEEPEPQPPKEAIRIVEMSEESEAPKEEICKVCKDSKPVYVEVESQGTIEYMCKECFEKDLRDEGKQCWSCKTALEQDDAFCGKCGSPTEKKCPKCDVTAKDDDAFCGKCGTKL